MNLAKTSDNHVADLNSNGAIEEYPSTHVDHDTTSATCTVWYDVTSAVWYEEFGTLLADKIASSTFHISASGSLSCNKTHG
jgi:hypothetical protein